MNIMTLKRMLGMDPRNTPFWPKARPRKSAPTIFYQASRMCPGRRHAWFDSSVGPVRKELAQS